MNTKFNKLKDKQFLRLSKIGYDITELNKEFDRLNLNGNIDGLKNYIWRKLNSLVNKHQGNNQKLTEIYFEMLMFSDPMEKSRDKYIKTLYYDSLIRSTYESTDMIDFEIVILSKKNDKICKRCREDNYKKYNFDYALKNHLLPHESCTCEYGCTCTLGFIPKRDKNGRLIFND
ncbi:hypothetical protein [uncultured Chryseobacterium sp.]|uniref:hypothetical protein n=1 Tax=uncultured Chryseobacterium sp. TaxID=259322 RepID=UPI002583B5FE|nr:hypothetical protein [uncultured Chryseobacterium sp.]